MLKKNNFRSSSSSMEMTKEQPSSSPRQSSVSSFMAAVSPRFFNGFLARTLSEPECSATMSPTSILDAKPFDPNSDSLQNRNSFEKIDGVGLAILDSLIREKNGTHLVSKSNSKMVLFGAKLKVQIPAAVATGGGGVSPGGGGTPKSPGDFGIKTRNAHLFVPPSGFGSPLKSSKVSPRELDLSEMELSEDYTCVIKHGPNPKTTHIFDDCVVDDCCGVVKLSELRGKDYGFPAAEDGGEEDHAAASFLKVCDSCSECLGHGQDVFMYRGEMAFCSHECRSQEMIAEGGKNLED